MALKDMPQAFNVDSEEDIRIAVVKYFQELGVELDEIRAETRFTIQLGHNELPIGGQKISQRDQVTGRSDLLLRRSEEHTSELQSPDHLVCRLLLEKKKYKI